MPLNTQEIDKIQEMSQSGNQFASRLIPVLEDLVKNNRLNDVSDAINQFTGHAEVNGPQIRTYLIARVPGLLMNDYWSKKESSSSYDKLIRYTLKNDRWATSIKNAVDFGGNLEVIASQIETEAMSE